MSSGNDLDLRNDLEEDVHSNFVNDFSFRSDANERWRNKDGTNVGFSGDGSCFVIDLRCNVSSGGPIGSSDDENNNDSRQRLRLQHFLQERIAGGNFDRGFGFGISNVVGSCSCVDSDDDGRVGGGGVNSVGYGDGEEGERR